MRATALLVQNRARTAELPDQAEIASSQDPATDERQLAAAASCRARAYSQIRVLEYEQGGSSTSNIVVQEARGPLTGDARHDRRPLDTLAEALRRGSATERAGAENE